MHLRNVRKLFYAFYETLLHLQRGHSFAKTRRNALATHLAYYGEAGRTMLAWQRPASLAIEGIRIHADGAGVFTRWNDGNDMTPLALWHRLLITIAPSVAIMLRTRKGYGPCIPSEIADTACRLAESLERRDSQQIFLSRWVTWSSKIGRRGATPLSLHKQEILAAASDYVIQVLCAQNGKHLDRLAVLIWHRGTLGLPVTNMHLRQILGPRPG